MPDEGRVLRLLVDVNEAEPRRLDEAARTMGEDLRRVGVRADLEAAAVSGGGKSGQGMLVGSLVVTGVLSGTALNAIAKVVVAFVNRAAARTVTIVDGDQRITLKAASGSGQRVALDAWLARRDLDTE